MYVSHQAILPRIYACGCTTVHRRDTTPKHTLTLAILAKESSDLLEAEGSLAEATTS